MSFYRNGDDSGPKATPLIAGLRSKSLVHYWTPLCLLWIGAALSTSVLLLLLSVELSISGGLAHMGYSSYALPLYLLRCGICLWMAWKSRSWLRTPVSPAMKWARTVGLTLVGLVAILGLARIFFFFDPYDKAWATINPF
ncbi:MAG: hypothetical protein K1X53_14930 [Candidatus Sumerlaeaceae bacterium]|nr:hypothetical protein [Candidatus Sumerlaeaceae bacterium]